MSFQELYTTAIDLQPHDKAVLAYGLLATLNAETDEDTTELWLAESERRFARYQEHRQSLSATDFLTQMAVELSK
jgi:Putative addiction module component